MGCILPRDGYLERVCEVAHEYVELFTLDEVVTGIRYAPGGCQQHYNLTPDLSTFGKALGAGFPVGAVAAPRTSFARTTGGTGLVPHFRTFHRPPPPRAGSPPHPAYAPATRAARYSH